MASGWQGSRDMPLAITFTAQLRTPGAAISRIPARPLSDCELFGVMSLTDIPTPRYSTSPLKSLDPQ